MKIEFKIEATGEFLFNGKLKTSGSHKFTIDDTITDVGKLANALLYQKTVSKLTIEKKNTYGYNAVHFSNKKGQNRHIPKV